MIEQSDSMEVLVASCPTFRENWEQHLVEWGNGVLFVAAGAFAEHLLSLHMAKDESSFPKVAAAIERLHNEGTPAVKELATVGVLEGIQNFWANRGADPEVFGRYLEPESRRRWDNLNASWTVKAPNAGVAG
jgi:hypothetical protein